MFFHLFICHFRPIFIVHDSEDNNVKSGISETDSSQHVDMEINNNNSPYLHGKCEDKGDKIDKRVQCENKNSQVVTSKSFSREKLVEKSLKQMIEIMEETNKIDVKVAFSSDSDESLQSHNEFMTPPPDKVLQFPDEITENSSNESDEKVINNGELIKIDSERLEAKFVDEVNQAAITTSEVPLINEGNSEVTPSGGESDYFVFVYHAISDFKEAANFLCLAIYKNLQW